MKKLITSTLCVTRASRSPSSAENTISLLHQDTMTAGRVLRFMLTLLVAALPLALCADDCASPSATAVRLAASSYRNLTGHWITQASLARKSSREVSGLRSEERPWHYEVDVNRQNCGDVEAVTTTFNVLVPPPRVGPDYAYFPNVGFYKLHTEKMKWEDALRACAKEGAHLAILNSAEEGNAIRELMSRHSTDNFAAFIGFHDMFKEGEYVTIFGDPLSSTGHVKWTPGEPNNKVFPGSPEGEDCGNIYRDGTINDVRCSLLLFFVCEQSI